MTGVVACNKTEKASAPVTKNKEAKSLRNLGQDIFVV